MVIIRAKSAGFCMGVSLALKALDQAVDAWRTGRLIMLGPIIHNPQVIARYTRRGVLCLEEPNLLRAGDTVVIRAHGIPLSLECKLRALGVNLVDATCPRVKAAQTAIAEATASGARLLLFGEEHHPEVRGLISYARNGCVVFSSPEDVRGLKVAADEPVVLAAQTTQDKAAFFSITEALRGGGHALRVLSTICDATSRRQQEVLEIASRVEAMVVVGGQSSGNTRRLADVARSAGIPAFLVEGADNLQRERLAVFSRVGLTAGASTPRAIIDAVQAALETPQDGDGR